MECRGNCLAQRVAYVQAPLQAESTAAVHHCKQWARAHTQLVQQLELTRAVGALTCENVFDGGIDQQGGRLRYRAPCMDIREVVGGNVGALQRIRPLARVLPGAS